MIPLQTSLSSALALCALAIISACSPADSDHSDAKSGELLTLQVGSAQLKVELAVDPSSQARGLMFRDALPENQGMLFIFAQPKQMSFWMRNTDIPLDIGFFTPDGVLREIYPLYPHDEASRKSVRHDLLYALEVNQGWFKRNGVKPGDRFDPASLVY